MTSALKDYKHRMINVDELIEYTHNSRTHSDSQINQIKASIQEFGFTNPVLLDENNVIIAGHGRLVAVKQLGIKQVPCVILEGLSETQKRAYVIADNQIALNSDWDVDALEAEISALTDAEFDLDLLGFKDIDAFLNEDFDFDAIDESLANEAEPKEKRCPHCQGVL